MVQFVGDVQPARLYSIAYLISSLHSRVVRQQILLFYIHAICKHVLVQQVAIPL
jgi:hypothetical protein